MNTYRGPATVIADGIEHDVDADLVLTVHEVPIPGYPGETLTGPSIWKGTLKTLNTEAAWNIYDCEDPRLRVEGDKRQGRFITTRHQTDSNTIEIKGRGKPPFGD